MNCIFYLFIYFFFFFRLRFCYYVVINPRNRWHLTYPVQVTTIQHISLCMSIFFIKKILKSILFPLFYEITQLMMRGFLILIELVSIKLELFMKLLTRINPSKETILHCLCSVFHAKVPF